MASRREGGLIQSNCLSEGACWVGTRGGDKLEGPVRRWGNERGLQGCARKWKREEGLRSQSLGLRDIKGLYSRARVGVHCEKIALTPGWRLDDRREGIVRRPLLGGHRC